MPTNLDNLMQAYDFTGRTIAMTGGTGVIGSAIVCALAERGARLAILNRNAERGAQLLKRLGNHSQNAALFPADVLNVESLRQAAADVLARFEKVDVLINAAGGNQPNAITTPDLKFFDLPSDGLRDIFGLNFLGTFYCCQIFGKHMAQRASGVILNVSSMSAYRPLTRVVAYSAAKAALNNFTQWLAVHMAQEYSPHIRVNAIAPGFFLTDLNRHLLLDRETGESTARGKAILAHTPMGRFGVPEDLIGAALWLLSPASEFVTGAIVPIDGGFSACAGV
jgi:NAD(P)-dependent dehydrogenase (short-subunit alcohol dehydrogenase family)